MTKTDIEVHIQVGCLLSSKDVVNWNRSRYAKEENHRRTGSNFLVNEIECIMLMYLNEYSKFEWTLRVESFYNVAKSCKFSSFFHSQPYCGLYAKVGYKKFKKLVQTVKSVLLEIFKNSWK
jgi:hypothetical protein